MPKITAIMFDCDNTLALSEDLAFEASAGLTNDLLAEQGISDRYTSAELIIEFVGQTFRGIMISLQQKYGFKLTSEEVKTWVYQEEERVVDLLSAKCRECLGCGEQLEKLAASQKYQVAIVSSSGYPRIYAAIKKIGHDKYFKPEHIYSASSSLPIPTSKPDPAVYLWAMQRLGKKPKECVAVEDSGSGANSAVRAGIHLIGYVGSYHGAGKQAEMKKMLEDIGAKAVMTHWSQFPDCLAKVEKSRSERLGYLF